MRFRGARGGSGARYLGCCAGDGRHPGVHHHPAAGARRSSAPTSGEPVGPYRRIMHPRGRSTFYLRRRERSLPQLLPARVRGRMGRSHRGSGPDLEHRRCPRTGAGRDPRWSPKITQYPRFRSGGPASSRNSPRSSTR